MKIDSRLFLLVVLTFLMSCKTNMISTERTSGNKNPETSGAETFKPHFVASGNEPFWNVQIAMDFIKIKFMEDSLLIPHEAPIRAMDANVKMYKLKTANSTIGIQIIQAECTNSMSGKKSPYKVEMRFLDKNTSKETVYDGCGNYITDYRLHDIWVLEKMNGRIISKSDFSQEFPLLEIKSAENTFIGFAGCNQMNGQLFSEDQLLRFTNVVTTRKMCEPTNKEQEFLKTLESGTTYKIENRRLTLSNPNGELLVFKKID